MQTCVGLARAETHTGVLDWFNSPVTDLYEWAEAIEAIEKRTKRKK